MSKHCICKRAAMVCFISFGSFSSAVADEQDAARPTLADLMSLTQLRHYKLWYAERMNGIRMTKVFCGGTEHANGANRRARTITRLMYISLALSWSATAQADYQVGVFRCYKPGPDEERPSIWRITAANDNIRAPFVEFTSPSLASAQPFTIRSYGTVTELPAATVVSVSAFSTFQGARYFNLIFEKAGIRMGDTPCHKEKD